MKLKFFYLFTVVLLLSACKSSEEEITAVVHRWNDLHNGHDVEGFRDIYDTQVLFYGRNYTNEKCYLRKRNFLKPSFSQDIVTPVSISYFKSGIIKCDFTKRTWHQLKTSSEHVCYLIMKKYDDQYLITGEGDVRSDEKRNTTPELGEPINKPGKGQAIYLTAVLLMVGGASAFAFKKRKLKEAVEWEAFKKKYQVSATAEPGEEQPTKPVIDEAELTAKIKAAVAAEMRTHVKEESSAEKGFQFEKFIVEKFNKEYFKLIEWRSDKIHKGIYAFSNMLPDLEYQFITSRYNCMLAIECKWRAGFKGRRIEVAREEQLERYWQYAHQNQIIVFILLGVGGSPGNPEDLYIIPLQEIPGPKLYQNQLQNYKRYRQKGEFFFNAATQTLE